MAASGQRERLKMMSRSNQPAPVRGIAKPDASSNDTVTRRQGRQRWSCWALTRASRRKPEDASHRGLDRCTRFTNQPARSGATPGDETPEGHEFADVMRPFNNQRPPRYIQPHHPAARRQESDERRPPPAKESCDGVLRV